MPKSRSRIVKPPLDRFGGIRVVQRRIKKSEVIEHNKDKVAQELLDIATANVMDILQVENNKVSLRDLKEIPEAAIKAIKSIQTVETKYGTQFKIEMHDKVSTLRILAKAAGFLEQHDDINRPSVIGIQIKGPEPEVIEAEEVIDENKKADNSGGSGETPDKDAEAKTE